MTSEWKMLNKAKDLLVAPVDQNELTFSSNRSAFTCSIIAGGAVVHHGRTNVLKGIFESVKHRGCKEQYTRSLIFPGLFNGGHRSFSLFDSGCDAPMGSISPFHVENGKKGGIIFTFSNIFMFR